MSKLIRLTRIEETKYSDPVEVLVNPDHIVKVEALKANDRYVLLIKTLDEKSMARYAAVDKFGFNTIKEESAKEVVENFRRYVN